VITWSIHYIPSCVNSSQNISSESCNKFIAENSVTFDENDARKN
jgi:hypothetical protein